MTGGDGWVLRIVCLADGRPSARDGQYVIAFDRAGPAMATGRELRAARRFATPREAHGFWRQSAGVRRDGLLDRPMTAWTVEVLTVQDALTEDV